MRYLYSSMQSAAAVELSHEADFELAPELQWDYPRQISSSCEQLNRLERVTAGESSFPRADVSKRPYYAGLRVRVIRCISSPMLASPT